MGKTTSTLGGRGSMPEEESYRDSKRHSTVQSVATTFTMSDRDRARSSLALIEEVVQEASPKHRGNMVESIVSSMEESMRDGTPKSGAKRPPVVVPKLKLPSPQ